ncbi:putative nuclease HARBI1 [Pholidichthys leucotaenia]
MTFPGPVWLAVQRELLSQEADGEVPTCFDRYDDETLFKLFHLSRPCITFIADTVRSRLQNSALKKAQLSVDEMVKVSLSYYAHGHSTMTDPRRPGFNETAIVGTVSGVISGMSDVFISFPQTSEARTHVALKVEKLSGIPSVLGVLAPAHFKTTLHPYEQEFRSFVNAQGYTSVVSQFICDSDGNIMSVEKCCAGGTFEQEMWDSSFKGKEMVEDLHGPFWLIGGNGYHLSKHVLTPVSNPRNDNEVRFNEAHERMLHVMQTTLTSMKRRFKCLMQLGFAQGGALDKQSIIIKACSVLHNIAKKFSVPLPPENGFTEEMYPGRQHSVPVEINPEALKARQELIDGHFSVVSSSWDPFDRKNAEHV